ncbi:MAG: TerB family tellurite resistance protein [Flavobacterium sp.]|nr:TerB family tellurite resistance protein [Flavobacterium sp.]
MSISDLFDGEFSTRNKGHFSAIVRVALTDGTIDDRERAFLDYLAKKLSISNEEYQEILENPSKYPINPPYLHSQRLERLFDLGRMVHSDHQLGDTQERLLRRFAVALGFTPANAPYIVDKALSLIDKRVDLDTFVYEMTNMNK